MECNGRGSLIHVDSSSNLVTIAGSGKTGNPFQRDPHLLIYPRISSHLVLLAALTLFSC